MVEFSLLSSSVGVHDLVACEVGNGGSRIKKHTIHLLKCQEQQTSYQVLCLYDTDGVQFGMNGLSFAFGCNFFYSHGHVLKLTEFVSWALRCRCARLY